MLIKIQSETKKNFKIIEISQMKIPIYFSLFTMCDLHFLIKASGLCSGIKGLNKSEVIKFLALNYPPSMKYDL